MKMSLIKNKFSYGVLVLVYRRCSPADDNV